MYSNSNIFPETEFERRFATLEKWANEKAVLLIKDDYDESEWSSRVVKFGEAEPNTPKRLERCGECYQLRLVHAAKFASANNVKYLSSTLAVSPYQYYEELKKRLEIVCEHYNLKPVLMDFRPFYSEATRESKEQNMYRQKYCGCAFSYNESMEQFKRTNKSKYIEELKAIVSD